MGAQLELFEEKLPHKPYATDDLSSGLKIQTKQKALQKKYLQHNPPAHIHWLVLDVDKPCALEVASQEKAVPSPNFGVYNRDNGHSHLFYGLAVPVVRTEAGRAKPLRYAAAVEASLREAFGADPGYAGLISKNPLHKAWEVVHYKDQLWSLGELADYLELPAEPTLTDRQKLVGLGRNCTLFELVRHWAYKAVLTFRLSSNQASFSQAVLEQCQKVNQGFSPSLPHSEVKATAKSIAKWTWKNYTALLPDDEWQDYVARTHTAEIQAKRGKKGGLLSGVARARKNEAKKAQALAMRAEGLKQVEIAQALGVGQGTVSKWLKD